MREPTAGPAVAERLTVEVPPKTAWAAVSDVRRMGEWSPECRGAWLLGSGVPLRPGARFLGRNRASWLPWVTLCRVVAAVPGEVFAFDVSFFGVPLSRWTYRFTAVPGGCEVTEEWHDRRRGLPAGCSRPPPRCSPASYGGATATGSPPAPPSSPCATRSKRGDDPNAPGAGATCPHHHGPAHERPRTGTSHDGFQKGAR